MSLDFPTATSVGQVYNSPEGNVYVCTVVGPPAQWVGSGSSTNLDATYLRKDASNDPVTGTLTVTPSTNVEGLVVTQGAARTAAALRITNEGSGNALIVEDSANPDSTPVVIDSSGNLGLGTTSPLTKFVLGSSGGYAAGSAADNCQLVVQTANGTSKNGLRIVTNNYGSASSTYLDLVNFGSKDLNIQSGFRITGGVDSGGGNSNPYLSFSTVSLGSDSTTATVALSERMRITSAGDLLIGGTLPSAPNAQITASGSIVCGGLTAGILNTDSTTIETSSTATVSTGFTLGTFRQALLGVSSASSSSSTFAGGLYIINRESTAGSVGTILGANGLTSVTINGTTGLISFTPSVSTFRGWRFSYIVVA